jgi:hypothetical protein
MVKTIPGAAPERRPSKLITLYLPGAFGFLLALGSIPQIEHRIWMLPLSIAGATIVGFLMSWPFIMAVWHGFRFFRSLFNARDDATPPI